MCMHAAWIIPQMSLEYVLAVTVQGASLQKALTRGFVDMNIEGLNFNACLKVELRRTGHPTKRCPQLLWLWKGQEPRGRAQSRPTCLALSPRSAAEH